jgi:hypothetical protein
MTFAFGEKIKVYRAGSRVDPYSNETTADWSTATSFEVEGCAVYPTDSFEHPSVDNSAVTSGFTVLAPAGTVITRKDRVSIRGETVQREVTGDPFDWHHPFTGWDPGVAFEIEGDER